MWFVDGCDFQLNKNVNNKYWNLHFDFRFPTSKSWSAKLKLPSQMDLELQSQLSRTSLTSKQSCQELRCYNVFQISDSKHLFLSVPLARPSDVCHSHHSFSSGKLKVCMSDKFYDSNSLCQFFLTLAWYRRWEENWWNLTWRVQVAAFIISQEDCGIFYCERKLRYAIPPGYLND